MVAAPRTSAIIAGIINSRFIVSPLLVLESHSRGRVETGSQDRERVSDQNLLLCDSDRATCFVTIHPMQSFDTKTDLPPGACTSFELPDGNELAVYNVDGEFYATENFCPDRKSTRLNSSHVAL